MNTPYTPQAAIDRLLRAHSTLTLATRDADGRPMAASLFFVSDEALRVYWVSAASSRHSRNLAADPRAALTVHVETWSWQDIAGVQMEGTVDIVAAGKARDAAQALYLAKFAFAEQFDSIMAKSEFYRFVPAWARLIDNRVKFGHKEEISFQSGFAS